MDFKEFPKIPRLSREVIITEKIDGTNGCIRVGDGADFLVGSRTRWITPEQDNYGFASWAYNHREELVSGLGIGVHFGEWWGSGIQRGYNLSKGEKRFSLFNTLRWGEERDRIKYPNDKPDCCYVVPVIARGIFTTGLVRDCLDRLEDIGSLASPGFMNPEGVVIYHIAGNLMFKKTLKKDDEYKGKQNE